MREILPFFAFFFLQNFLFFDTIFEFFFIFLLLCLFVCVHSPRLLLTLSN